MALINYIEKVERNIIVARSDQEHAEMLRKLGASKSWRRRGAYVMEPKGEAELAFLLQELQKAGFLFLGGESGWPPSAVFMDMRLKGLVCGKIEVVTWKDKHTPVVRQL